MIDLIIRHCIKNYQNTDDENVRERYSVLGGILGIICNLLLFAGKFTVGTMSNSIGIVSDSFNNLTDMGSSFISVVSAKLSNRPPDKEHPFGHGRFEYLSSLAIGILVLVVGFKLCETSAEKFFSPEPVDFSYWNIIVLLVSIGVAAWMYSYNRYIGKKINSGVSEATAADSISDAVATAGVLIATILQPFTSLPVDAIAGIGIGLMIMYTGFGIAKDVVNILLGQAPDPELIRAITTMALDCKYVVGIHDIRIHDYGPGRMFGTLHAEVPDTVNLVNAHAALDVLEDELEDKFHMEVTIHMDPLSTDEKQISHIREILDSFVHEKYPRYHTDNLRITAGDDRWNIICDIHVPPEEYNPVKIRVIRKNIEAALRQHNDKYRVSLAKIIADPQPPVRAGRVNSTPLAAASQA